MALRLRFGIEQKLVGSRPNRAVAYEKLARIGANFRMGTRELRSPDREAW